MGRRRAERNLLGVSDGLGGGFIYSFLFTSPTGPISCRFSLLDALGCRHTEFKAWLAGALNGLAWLAGALLRAHCIHGA